MMDWKYHVSLNIILQTLLIIQSIHAQAQNGSYNCEKINISNSVSTTFTLNPNADNVTKVYFVDPINNAKSCEINNSASTYTVNASFNATSENMTPNCSFSFNNSILTLKFRSYAVDGIDTVTDRYFTYTCNTTFGALTLDTLLVGVLVQPSNINVSIVTLSTAYSAILEYWDGTNTVASGKLGDNVRLRFTYYHSSNKDYLDYRCGIITNCITANNPSYSGNVSFIGANGCHVSQDIIAINSGFVSNTSLNDVTHYYAMTPYFDLRSFESTSIPPLTVYVECDVTYYYGPCNVTSHCNARRKRDVSDGLTRTSRVRAIITINDGESDKKTTISEDKNITETCLESFTFKWIVSVLSTLIAIFFSMGLLVYLSLRRFPTKEKKAGTEFTNPVQSKSLPILQAVTKAS